MQELIHTPNPSPLFIFKNSSLKVMGRSLGLLSMKCLFSLLESESFSAVSDSLWPHGLQSPWNSPGQNTGVHSLSLLQRIFPTQGLNPGLPNCRRILYQLSHKGSPRILEIKPAQFHPAELFYEDCLCLPHKAVRSPAPTLSPLGSP